VSRPSARTLGLGGLVVALLVVLLMVLGDDGDGPAAVLQPRADDLATAPSDAPVVDVKLEALQRDRPEIGAAQRNLFRFQLPPAPPSPPPLQMLGPLPVGGPPVAGPVGPPPPSPPPSIPIKYIGVVGPQDREGQVVFFSDGQGHVLFGKEGDIIEGRYRVLKVSPDAAELAYLDGRGSQTIRLSGQ
jgi:hypothetical protein